MDFKVCRGCMASENDTKCVSIFRGSGKMAQFILELTNLKIPHLKEAPALLCRKCIKDLKRAISFRESFIKNHQKFSKFHLLNDPLTERLKVESEKISLDKHKRDEHEQLPSEDPINVNDLKNSKFQISVIKEEPIDIQSTETNSSSGSDNDDSTSDDFLLKFPSNSPKTDDKSQQQVTSFLCQRCGQIATKTCKFCKTKVIPRHEENKTKQRKRIIEKYLENPNVKLAVLARISQAPRTTVRRTIESYKNNKKNERKTGSGRKIGSGNREREEKIIETVRLNPELSIRTLARMFGTCPSNVQKIKVKHGYFCENKKKRRNFGGIGGDESENSGFGGHLY